MGDPIGSTNWMEQWFASQREAWARLFPGLPGAQAASAAKPPVNPLLSAVEGMTRAWTAGDTAVVLSDARAPSVLFALAELSARAEFPPGAYGRLHGDGSTQLALERALGA